MPLNTNSNVKVDSRENTNVRVNADGQGTHVGGDGAVRVENRGRRGNNQVNQTKSDKTALVDSINAQRAADRVAATQGRVQAVSASEGVNAGEPDRRYRKAAISPRVTKSYGRKEPSGYPMSVPSPASQMMSA